MCSKLHDFILVSAHAFSDKISLQIKKNNDWVRLTYAELKKNSEIGSTILKDIGIQKGDNVVLLTDNSPEAMIAYLAVLMAEATVVLIDPTIPHEELKKTIESVDVRALLVSRKFLPHLKSLVPATVVVRHLEGHFLPCDGFATRVNSHSSVDQLIDDEKGEVASILFTSGTTGHSKGVLLTHQNLITAIKMGQKVTETGANDRVLSILPICHISPLVQNIMSLHVGATITCIDQLEVPSILNALVETKPTIIGVVPLILELFLNQIKEKINQQASLKQLFFRLLFATSAKLGTLNLGKFFFKSVHNAFGGQLTRIICGGAFLKASTKKEWQALGFTIIEAYGLTETTGPVCSTRLGQSTNHVGIPFPDQTFKIISDDGSQEGEICIRGSLVMKGYFNDPISTKLVLQDGWFRTGDIGYFDHQGCLNITGRKKEVIVLSSGKKVTPNQVEAYYRAIDFISELAVFGVQTEQSFEKIYAAIVLDKQQDHSFSVKSQVETHIHKRCSELPPHLQIQALCFVEEIPKTKMLKVKRTLLKEWVQTKKIIPFASSNSAQHQTIKIQELEKWIKQWITNKNNIPFHQIDNNKPFDFFGMNSLTILQLCNDLEAWSGIKVHPATFWEYPSIGKLVNFLANQSTEKKENSIVDRLTKDPIAIVGMACRFPDRIVTPEQLWTVLMTGHCAIKPIPQDRWQTDINYSGAWGGFIEGINLFDAHFFEISPLEANDMDPQHRLLLEVSWEALERSHILPSSLQDSRTGVYIGICTNDYSLLQTETKPDAITPYFGLGNSLSAAAGRIAYFLGLQGICKAIDTACSSSLVALHDACQDLRHGLSDTAIVGGVNAILSPIASISFNKARMLAPDGYCKVFDEKADGYVRSEGCGVVVLKRLSDAKRDGNPILALIMGSAVNQDGHSNGMTAPNGNAQVQLYRAALQQTAFNANQINYIEAHGTGTPLGDPIEIRSIAQVYGENRLMNDPLFIGAVKSHLGHLEAAAGITGLMKTILILQNRKIPPQIHFNKLNPLISIDETAIQIPTNLIHWSQATSPFRAAVSAFGFTGTNVHIILQEASQAPPMASKSLDKPFYLLTLSAKTEEALQQKIIDLRQYLEESNDALSDICYTLNTCRQHFKKRCAFVIQSLDQLRMALQQAFQAQTNQTNTVFASDFSSQTDYQKKLIKIQQDYCQGHDIDWASFYGNDSYRKISLPTYPFKRQPYWFQQSHNIQKNKTHPFLEKKINTTSISKIIFESEIDEFSPAFIKDHKVYGLPVVAAATYLSAILSYIASLSGNAYFTIENVIIYEPLIALPDQKRIVQIIISGEPGDQSFEIISCEKISQTLEQPHWIKHVIGDIKAEDNVLFQAIDSLDQIEKRCVESYAAERFYQMADQLGLTYRDQFQGLKNIYLGSNEALGSFIDNDEHDQRYCLHPGLIDSCFQMLLSLFLKMSLTELYIPIGIRQFKYHPRLGKPKWVYVKNASHTSEVDFSDGIAFHLMNEFGQTVGEITGFTVKKVTKNALLKNVNQCQRLDWFYELSWQPKNLPQLPIQNKLVGHFGVFSDSSELCQRLCDRLQLNHIQTSTLIDWQTLDDKAYASLEGIICCFRSNTDISSMPVEALRETLQQWFIPLLALLKKQVKHKIKSFWLITDHSLLQASFSGLLNTFLLENPTLRACFIELEMRPPTLGEAYLEEASRILFNEIIHQDDEKHIIYRQGVRYVERLQRYNDTQTDDLIVPDHPFFQLAITQRGLLQNLKFQSIDPLTTLGAHQIAIQVKAAGVNFRDVLNILGLYPGDPGPLGADCSGIVIAVGDQVKSFKLNDEVMGFAVSGAFANYALSDEKLLIKKPDHLSFDDAASLPTAFLTAYLALITLGQLQKDDKVLIHAASGGVGIAAIQLAQQKGAVVFATAGSPHKRHFLKKMGVHYVYDSRSHSFAEEIIKDTCGEGIQVVLNSLSGEGFIEKTVQLCGKAARFLEIGKRDIWDKEKMSQIRPDIHYHIIALDELIKQEPAAIKKMFEVVIPFFVKHQMKALPTTVFPLTKAPSAFRLMQKAHHIGKIIITHASLQSIHPEGCYLITGGFGSLGLELLKWFIEKGAKNIILLGRRLPTPILQNSIHQLEQSHAITINYVQADVSCYASLKNLFLQFGSTLPPLKGIIHAAGLLRDKLFLEQEWEDLDNVFISKIYGAWNLHRLTLGIQLDFFILFSSVASILGSPGQSNYSAANAFLDGLAVFRNKWGLPALSINWGPWTDIGMAAQLDKMMAQRGITALTPKQGIQSFNQVFNQKSAQLMIMQVAWEKIKSSTVSLSHLLDNISLSQTPGPKGTSALLLSTIKRAEPSVRPQLLRRALKECVSMIMGLDIEKWDNQTDFDTLGMDSLMALQLQNLIEESLGKAVLESIAAIYQYKNIDSLANYLEERLRFLLNTPDNINEINQHKPHILEPLIKMNSLPNHELLEMEKYIANLIQPHFLANVSKTIARKILSMLCRFYFRLDIKGLEHLPQNKSFFICPNHTSFLDSVVLGLIDRKFSSQFIGFLAKEYFYTKSFSLINLIIDVVPFDRSREEHALLKNLKYIELCKKRNKILLLFPEGTRSKDGKLQKFKNGAVWFAEQAGLDIIPAYIDGGYRLMPRGRFFPRPGRLSITFGKALDLPSLQSEKSEERPVLYYQQQTKRLVEAILALSQQS